MNAIADAAPTAADAQRAKLRRRAWWLRQLHTWHWISAALSLVGMLLFAAAGITLNHAEAIPATPRISRSSAELPAPLLATLREAAARQSAETAIGKPLPSEVADWLDDALQLDVAGHAAEWSADEVYVSLPRPGGDGWVAITLASGHAELERTERGLVSLLNDLHKGRHAGRAWRLFLDVFSVACLLFSVTGLWLLHLHSKGRRLTWPLVALGCAVPLLLALVLIH